MKNPHKQFPGRMDTPNKKKFRRGYKTLKQGNVKNGYEKLKHVKLFENFDQEPKWFVAQDGDEKFKFQAKDMDEAKEYASKTWNAEVLGEVTEDMEFEDTPMDESEINEGSYTDFLTSYGAELQTAVKKLKEIGEVYDYKIENLGDDLDKAMDPYDKNVGEQIESWVGGNVSIDEIAKFAIDNQDRYGTEPKMVLDAIDDYYTIFTMYGNENLRNKNKFGHVNETGEWSRDMDWQKVKGMSTDEIQNDDEAIQIAEMEARLNALQNEGANFEINDIQGFDKYQGPYATIEYKGDTYRIWFAEHDELFVEDWPQPNTDRGFIGPDEEILKILK